ncbi:hypothetical protein [Dactylosporangium sp. CA-233914]|uniref:hypothetical protein n=1 Tax=Dactylosporangium sp. CA-233914 TaxID=3239934 RepID=UPI003D8F11D2
MAATQRRRNGLAGAAVVSTQCRSSCSLAGAPMVVTLRIDSTTAGRVGGAVTSVQGENAATAKALVMVHETSATTVASATAHETSAGAGAAAVGRQGRAGETVRSG